VTHEGLRVQLASDGVSVDGAAAARCLSSPATFTCEFDDADGECLRVRAVLTTN
jgi:hypothetical protein